MSLKSGFLAFALAAAPLFGGELQVSPDGLSPHAAITQIRAAKARGDASAWTVKVAPGRYVLSEPLVLRPEDSGTPSAPVRWVADGGAGEAVFAGGGLVTGWRDDGDGTWSAPVPTGADGRPVWFQSLYVNGRRAVRSRHPNAGGFPVDSVTQTPVTNDAGAVTYVTRAVVKDAAVDALTGLSPDELAAVELQVRAKWSFGAFSVAGWSPADRTLTVVLSEKIKPWMAWTGEKRLFCLENVRTGFDAPGEWLYDKAAGRVRYRPRAGEALAALEAYAPTSGLSSLLRLEGDPAKGRLVTDVSFEGISFELSTQEGERLPSGFVQTYQYQGATRAGGCLYAKGAQRVAFDRCRVAHTENYAVRMDVGCVSNRIVRCELTDLGAGGVFIGDARANYFIDPKAAARYPFAGRKIPYGDPKAAARHPCAFVTVDDCTISHAGLVNPEGCGVLITQASDCAVTHCDIGDLYYTGVSVGWTWGYSESLSQRNTISFNRIHDIGKGVMSDMGGVYTLGTSFGTCVSNNVICNVKSFSYGGWGLYNDEGSEGIVMENNLVYDVKDAAYHQHFGRENVVRNNVFANAEKAQLALTNAEGHRSVTFDRNVVYWTGEAPFFDGPPVFIRVGDGDGTAVKVPVPEEKRVTAAKIGWGTNLVWHAGGAVDLGGVPHAVMADPLFADAAKNDFRLKEGSPALKIGFVPWDYAQAGRRTAREVSPREGIGHVLARLDAGEPVTVAYLGGSITAMSGWRNLTTDCLRKTWPKAKVTEVHAAIGGTGSGLGVFRLGHDALAKDPDLLFVEFATNDANLPDEQLWRNFDGIVQQTWQKSPKTDIVFVYTITSRMMKDYGEGRMNAAARAMERLADHYGIPSICFGPRVAAEVKAGRLVMSLGEVPTAVPEETPNRDRAIGEELARQGKTLFAKDGVHPARPGHELYLKSVVAALREMRGLPPADHARFVGRPYFDGTLAAAKMTPVTAAMLKGEGWERLRADDPEQKAFAARGGQVWRASKPGARLAFRFKGTRCDVYDLIGPKGANVRVTVDGKVVSAERPRFDSYCWYTRLATMPVYSGADGVHAVEIEVLEKQPDRTKVKHEATDTPKYDGTWFQPCQVLLVGDIAMEP